MNRGEALGAALGNLAVHKLRSGLSMLGMIFGVGAVIAMLSIGAGAERESLKMIGRLGLDNVIVRAKKLEREQAEQIRKKSVGVATRDARAIVDAIPGVIEALPRVRIDPYKVLADGRKSEAKVFGVAGRHAAAVGLGVAEGRFLDLRDEREHAQVCVIGGRVRRDLFGYGPALGRTLKVNDVWLEVVGVLAAGGVGGDSFEGVTLGAAESEVYLPHTTAARKFERNALDSPLDEIVVRLRPGASAREAAIGLKALLDRLHAGAADFEVVVPEALLEQRRKTQRLFDLVMGSIAGISLLVGGIGIMNILLASVMERTREIGVRRALGARRGDIRFQFLAESFAISLTGGAAGVAMGLFIAKVVAAWAGWPTVVTLWAVLLSTGVSMAVGLASGYYPASRAAELDPIDALRYE